MNMKKSFFLPSTVILFSCCMLSTSMHAMQNTADENIEHIKTKIVGDVFGDKVYLSVLNNTDKVLCYFQNTFNNTPLFQNTNTQTLENFLKDAPWLEIFIYFMMMYGIEKPWNLFTSNYRLWNVLVDEYIDAKKAGIRLTFDGYNFSLPEANLDNFVNLIISTQGKILHENILNDNTMGMENTNDYHDWITG